MNNKFDKYLNTESELEKESRYSIPQKEKQDLDSLRKQRQTLRIYMFYGFVIFLILFTIKSFIDNLTLIDTVGVNFFNLCKIPNI